MATYKLVQVDKKYEFNHYCWCFHVEIDGVVELGTQEAEGPDGSIIEEEVPMVYRYSQIDAVLCSVSFNTWAQETLKSIKDKTEGASEAQMADAPEIQI